MSTHNICFHGEISKISTIFGQKKHQSIPTVQITIFMIVAKRESTNNIFFNSSTW